VAAQYVPDDEVAGEQNEVGVDGVRLGNDPPCLVEAVEGRSDVEVGDERDPKARVIGRPRGKDEAMIDHPQRRWFDPHRPERETREYGERPEPDLPAKVQRRIAPCGPKFVSRKEDTLRGYSSVPFVPVNRSSGSENSTLNVVRLP